MYHDLANILQDTAKLTKSVTTVTVVSSSAHYGAKSLPVTIEEINDKEKYSAMAYYSRSKLMNVLFTKELADRLHDSGIMNVVVNAAHPGVVDTNAFAKMSSGIRSSSLPNFIRYPLLYVLDKLRDEFLWTGEEGALTQLYCAASRNITEGKISGKYFHPIALEMTPSELVTKENQVKLWTLSEELIRSKGY